MTLRYTRYLSLLAWVAALVTPLLIAPAVAQDYDDDDDNLIDVRSLEQLNAIRWDKNGNGALDTGITASDTMAYETAFPNAVTGMGCPGTCTGYELRVHLDMDTNGDGSVNASDTYANWDPINDYASTLKGNGYTISNLKVEGRNIRGLFKTTKSGFRAEGIGLINPSVTGTGGNDRRVGALAGHVESGGSVVACYVAGGSIINGSNGGGLVGVLEGTITSSYSSARVSTTVNRSHAGGLVGTNSGGTIRNSYSYGAVSNTGTGTGTAAGGFVGRLNLRSTQQPAIANSHFNASASGQTNGVGDRQSGVNTNINASSRTASQLQTPIGYTGIYANWNANIDGQTGNDDPWDFGTSSQYPVLKYGGHSPAIQRGDYDSDDDNLIDITTLEQLNAVRWDLNGNGVPDTLITAADTSKFRRAWLRGTANISCNAACTGYELMNDLDFDTDNSGTVDSNDDYPNWAPIGPFNLSLPNDAYTGTFKGNNNTISNLTISNNSTSRVGLFGGVAGTITGVGLQDANVTHAVTSGTTLTIRTGALAGVLTGTVRSSWVTGTVSSSSTRNYNYVGGLVGSVLSGGTVAASWADVDASVSAGSMGSGVGGLVGALEALSSGTATVIASYAAGSASNTATAGNRSAGGLVGYINTSPGGQYALTASYAAGTVSVPSTGSSRGLVGNIDGNASGSITASYWDTRTTNIADDADADAPEGKTTSELQMPTAYGTQSSDIYMSWNVNVNGMAGNDDPWDFGAVDQYPVLKFGMDAATIAAQFARQPVPQVRGVSVTPGTGELVVSWTAATNADGYKVQWKSGSENYDAADRQAVATGTTHTIANLSAAAEYTIRVIATRTNFDDGLASDEATGRPGLGKVSGVQVTPGLGMLAVSWAVMPGATGYKVQWKSGNEAYDPANREYAVVGRDTTITGLTTGTTYTVRVIATRTGFDDGPASDEVTGRPGLGKVSGVQVTPGLGALVVSWTAVPNATGYKVQWKSGDEGYDAADRQAVVTDGTTHTIASLIVGTEYTVRVIATRPNTEDGPASDEATGTPGESGTTLPEPDPDTEPVFIEAADPQTYRQNQAIEFTLPAAIDGNGTLTYTLTDLPEGLTFDAETLVVSGTPSEMTEKAIYTLTVTDEDGDSAEMSFFITVLANVAPSFGDASVSAQSYLRKQEIDSLTLPQASGGDGSLTYALTPALPDGLKFDAETLMLSGTPLEAIAETTYTLTATDGDGDEATLTFTLEVMADPMPTFGDTTIAAQSYVQHREIDSLTLPQASGGDGTLTYALTPDLPEGLSFDAETLIVSGIPIKAMDAMTYTLTATDGNGDVARLMFTLEIPDLMPTFGDTTIAAQSYLVNQQIESLMLPAATGGDGTLAYFLLPFLPDGLAFDPETRVLSGTPLEAMTETTYTLSALDADADVASLTFTLAVQMPSPDFDGDGNVNFADFILFVGKFGSRFGQDRYDARCDLNGDGQIDFADFLIFEVRFGATG